MVDGVYQDIYENLKPGVRESDIVALAHGRLFEIGSEYVEAVNAISGERSALHPHNFTDRLIRPGDTAFFDIIHVFNGYRTCYYRTFSVGHATQAQRDAYKQCREWPDAAMVLVKPGVTTDRIASVWPKATDFGFKDEMDAFGLQFGHGPGVALYDRPIISRLNSLSDPIELQRAWSSPWRPTAPPRTAALRPGSRRRLSARPTGPCASPSSRPRTSSSPTSTRCSPRRNW